MASDLLLPPVLDERLQALFKGIPSFPDWNSYLSGRNGVLDPLVWFQKSDPKASGAILTSQIEAHGIPFAPLAQHVSSSNSALVYLSALKNAKVSYEEVREGCLPVPIMTVGHVVIFVHCDPTLATPKDFPRHLSAPVWTTVDDYLRLREDFRERARSLWHSCAPAVFEPTTFKYDPKDISGAIKWLIAQPTLGSRERSALEFLTALPDSELTPARLSGDILCALASDRGTGKPFILPVGSLAINSSTVGAVKMRGRWTELGFVPYYSTTTHLFIAAENPDNKQIPDEAHRDFPGLKLVINYGHNESIRLAIAQLSANTGEVAVKRAVNVDDLSKAKFRYDPSEFVGKKARQFGENVSELVRCIIGEATGMRASDIHVDQFMGLTRIRYDIDGESVVVHSLPKDFSTKISNWLKENACKKSAESEKPGAPVEGNFIFGYLGKRITCRVAILFTHADPENPKIVIRIQDPSNGVKDLSLLGLSLEEMDVLRRNINLKQGLVIVAGATGTGKSTTLMACLQDINDPKRALYSLEDPIEYVIPGIAQVAVASKMEERTASRPMMTEGLRLLLRMAPKAIMVGEIRDVESGSAAVEASNTGHLIFATIHANSSIDVIKRFGSWNVDRTNFGENVRLITSQRLVKRLCSCYEKVPIDEPTKRVFECHQIPHSGFIGQKKPNGCLRCRGTGYLGRMVLMELLEVNQEISDLISEGAPTKEVRKAAERANFQTLLKSGLRRVATEQTSMEALAAAIDMPVVGFSPAQEAHTVPTAA